MIAKTWKNKLGKRRFELNFYFGHIHVGYWNLHSMRSFSLFIAFYKRE